MNTMVKWLNENNGFIMAVLTLVYVVATIFICIFNGKAASATRAQIQESKEQFREANRPNIIPCFTVVEGQLFCLTFKNIGNEVAKRLKITINEKWLECVDNATKQKQMPGDIRKSLRNEFFLEPKGELKFPLMIPGDGTTMYDELNKEIIKIDLSYERNDLSEKFNEKFELDLLPMAGIMLDESDFVRKMVKQERCLKDISKNIKDIVSAISKEKNDGQA